MDLLQSVLASVLSSGVFVAAAAWFLRRYFTQWIDLEFAKRSKILDSRLRLSEKYEAQLLEVHTTIIPNIQEVVYRSRNKLKELVEKQSEDDAASLAQYWGRLAEYLYQVQLFLPASAFEALHRYKVILQKASLLLGAALHRDTLDSPSDSAGEMSVADRALLSTLQKDAELQYHLVLGEMRALLEGKRL